VEWGSLIYASTNGGGIAGGVAGGREEGENKQKQMGAELVYANVAAGNGVMAQRNQHEVWLPVHAEQVVFNTRSESVKSPAVETVTAAEAVSDDASDAASGTEKNTEENVRGSERKVALQHNTTGTGRRHRRQGAGEPLAEGGREARAGKHWKVLGNNAAHAAFSEIYADLVAEVAKAKSVTELRVPDSQQPVHSKSLVTGRQSKGGGDRVEIRVLRWDVILDEGDSDKSGGMEVPGARRERDTRARYSSAHDELGTLGGGDDTVGKIHASIEAASDALSRGGGGGGEGAAHVRGGGELAAHVPKIKESWEELQERRSSYDEAAAAVLLQNYQQQNTKNSPHLLPLASHATILVGPVREGDEDEDGRATTRRASACAGRMTENATNHNGGESREREREREVELSSSSLLAPLFSGSGAVGGGFQRARSRLNALVTFVDARTLHAPAYAARAQKNANGT